MFPPPPPPAAALSEEDTMVAEHRQKQAARRNEDVTSALHEGLFAHLPKEDVALAVEREGGRRDRAVASLLESTHQEVVGAWAA